MKIRKSSRITAIVLALMMIVPLISVPAFAEDAATPLFTQNFDVEKVTDAIRQAGTGNASASIKDIGGEHGKVFMYDLSNGPANYYEKDGEGLLYLIVNKDGAGKRIKLVKDELTFNADGTVTGYATIDGTEYKFENAVLNKEYFDKQTTLYSFILTESYLFTTEGDFVYEEDLATAEYFLDEDDNQVNAADLVSGAVKYKMDDEGCLIALYETKSDAYATKYYLVTPECLNAICGTTNIGQPHWVNSTADIDGTEFTFSADYYISEDFTGMMDIRLKDTENFELAQIAEVSGNSSNVLVRIHSTDAAGRTENKGIEVAKGTWFNLTVYAKSGGAEGALEVYVNGNLAARGYDSSFSKLKIGNTNGKTGWSLGQPNRGSAAYSYAGYYMIDNLAIYAGKVIPEATAVPAYTNSMNFTKRELWIDYGTGKDSNNGVDWDQEHSLYNGTAFKINSDTFNEATGEDYAHATNVMDKNLYQKKYGKDLKGDKTYYFEADYFLVPGSTVKFEAQLKGGTATGTDKPVTEEGYKVNSEGKQFAWTTLFYVVSNEKGASLAFSDMDPKLVKYQTVLPTGRWFTLSTKLNLTTGEAVLYLDGQVAATYTLYRKDSSQKDSAGKYYPLGYLSNITVGAGNGLIAAKLSTMGNHKVNGTTVYYGHKAGEYANGYTDYVLVDNYQVYEDASLFKAAEPGFFYDDMEDRIWNVGDKALAAYPKGSKDVGPATATYVYTDDAKTNIALKIDMLPADSDKTTNKEFFGFGARAYYAPAEVESFNPDDGMDVNFAKLTQLAAGTDPVNGQDRIIYVARVGTDVYVYSTASNTKYEDALANEDGSNLFYRGVYKLVPETAEGSGLYSMKYWECFTGGSNIDRKFTTHNPKYVYNPAEGANNTYVFSASYYVTEDSYGNVENQFLDQYLDLYTLDLANKVLRNRLDGPITGQLLVEAWNKVDMIATLTEDDVLFDVYLNGVYTHSTTYSAKKAGHNYINANDWSIAKVGKTVSYNVIAALNGYVYVDDVAVQPLNADKMQTVALDNDVLTAVVDGVEVVLPNTQGKFYATEVVAGQTFDATVGADLFDTQDVASIRLKGPSGLRFVTKIDLAVLAAIEESFEVVEYGTAIKPVDYEGDCLYVPAYRDVFFEGYKDDANYFAGSIVNIKEGNMDRDFVGTAYAKIKLTNGAIVYVWAETAKVISVADQAVKTLAETDNSLYTAEELEVLNGFAAYAN